MLTMRTMINLSKRTCNRLKKLGTKGETYDDILKRLITEQEECKP